MPVDRSLCEALGEVPRAGLVFALPAVWTLGGDGECCCREGKKQRLGTGRGTAASS